MPDKKVLMHASSCSRVTSLNRVVLYFLVFCNWRTEIQQLMCTFTYTIISVNIHMCIIIIIIFVGILITSPEEDKPGEKQLLPKNWPLWL